MSKPLSDCAKSAINVHAAKIARERGSDKIEPIDILLGLTMDDISTSADALFLEHDTNRAEIGEAAKEESEIVSREDFLGKLSQSDSTKALIRHAEQESKDQVHSVGLILGILSLDEDDPARKVLRGFGLRYVHVRQAMSNKVQRTQKIRL